MDFFVPKDCSIDLANALLVARGNGGAVAGGHCPGGAGDNALATRNPGAYWMVQASTTRLASTMGCYLRSACPRGMGLLPRCDNAVLLSTRDALQSQGRLFRDCRSGCRDTNRPTGGCRRARPGLVRAVPNQRAKKRWVNVAMNVISISSPMIASTAAKTVNGLVRATFSPGANPRP